MTGELLTHQTSLLIVNLMCISRKLLQGEKESLVVRSLFVWNMTWMKLVSTHARFCFRLKYHAVRKPYIFPSVSFEAWTGDGKWMTDTVIPDDRSVSVLMPVSICL